MPFVLLLLGATCIGFAPNLVRIADTGPVASAFWRLFLAAPVLWLLYALRERRQRAVQPPAHGMPARAPWKLAVLATGFFFAADLGIWHIAIGKTTVANATLLANLVPVLSTLYALIVHGHRPGARFLLALLLAVGGAVWLVGPNFGGAAGHWRGDLLAVLAAGFYTAYLLVVGGTRGRIDTLRLMAWSTSVSAAFLLPVALSDTASGHAFLPNSALGWWVVIALALVTQIGGQGLIAHATARLPVSLAGTGLLLQPVVAAVVAWWAFGEALSGAQMAGAVVLLLGISIARRSTAP